MGGKKQRVSIARALLLELSILILDEATAAMVTETERLIQDVLFCSYRRTHDYYDSAPSFGTSQCRQASGAFKGRVAKFVTHTELLEKNGIYYKLVIAQRKMSQSLIKQQ